MEVSRELLFFFSALGAFNGLLLSVYFLFFIKNKKKQHSFLGLLLLLLSIRIAKSIFLFFNPNLIEVFVQVGLSACFLIGPALLLFLIATTNSKSIWLDKWWIQIFPFLILIIIISYLYPYYDYLKLWKGYLIEGIYWQWLFYLVISGYYIRDVFKSIFKKNNKISESDTWKISVYFGVFVIWVAYNTTAYTSYITGAISFTFILYILFLVLIFRRINNKNTKILKEKYADKKIEQSQASNYLKKIIELIEKEKLYKNSNLKSSDIAQKVHLTTHQFSQLLNDNLGKNFAVFINEFRINEAKHMICVNSNLTLESIGYECGFNSKSTFYTTFKKVEGTTPSKYKKSL